MTGPRPGVPSPWIAPWKPGLPQASCRGANHRSLSRIVVACTLTRGLCADCAQREGVEREPPDTGPGQLALGVD